MELDQIFGIHAEALKVHAARSEVLANNIVNADTPGFKAADIDFKSILNKSMNSGVSLAATQGQHFQMSQLGSQYPLDHTQPFQGSLDKNTVDADTEKMKFMENSIQYQANVQFLNEKIHRIMRAIKGE